MNILSYNPGHDGAIAYLKDARLVFSIESEKNSNWRYSPVSARDVFDAFGELDEVPDVICTGGWWPPQDSDVDARGSRVQYRGVSGANVSLDAGRLLGKSIKRFSSSHERSHLLCAFGMSDLPRGTPCYALLWEGVIGAFYEIDAELNITKLGDVMHEPGHRYALLYGLADPTFVKGVADFTRFTDAGKLMALASYSNRSRPTAEEEKLIEFLLQGCVHLRPSACEELKQFRYYNVGVDDVSTLR